MKTKKTLWAVLLLWLIVTATPVYSAEVSNNELLYLKNGSVVKCDKAWIASIGTIRCKKGHREILYSPDEVDLKKTFGESAARRLQEERKAREEKEFVWPGSEGYITVGIGRLSGDTTYQIGGTVVHPLGSSQLHFPISELEFPLDVWMVSVEGSKEFAEKWKVSVGVKKNITSDAGKMKDSDWGAYYLEGYPAEQNTLDVYSESTAELDALIIDFNLRYRFYERSNWSFIAGLGYIHQNFNFECSNFDQWYPSSEYYFGEDFGHDYGTGVGITYEVTYSIPYLEVATELKIKNKFSIEASLGYAPFVHASDEDNHLARTPPILAQGSYEGDAILLSLEGRYDFQRNWFLTAGFDYTKIEVDGEQDNYIYGTFVWTTDAEIKSEQIFAVLSVGYVF